MFTVDEFRCRMLLFNGLQILVKVLRVSSNQIAAQWCRCYEENNYENGNVESITVIPYTLGSNKIQHVTNITLHNPSKFHNYGSHLVFLIKAQICSLHVLWRNCVSQNTAGNCDVSENWCKRTLMHLSNMDLTWK